MSTKNTGRVVYYNGQFVPESDARISIYDSALMFGDMVFEMTRSFKKKQFKLREHLDRLYRSMKYLRITPPMTVEELERACMQTIEANDPLFGADDEHRLMINVSRGILSIYQDVVGAPKGSTVIIADFPLRWTVAGMGALYDAGINAIIPSQRAIPSELLEAKVKNRSRVHYMMANIEVSMAAGTNNWALLLDPSGFIAEGSGSNFFIVRGGKLITPRGRDILRGISREYVMTDLAAQLGLKCEEADIEPYDVVEAEEAFMTATPFCIMPVVSLNKMPIGDAKMGPVTQRLLKQWGENVGLDIVEQIKTWNAKDAGKPQGPSPYAFGKK